MNVDSLLNLERRTGIKNEDIDDFTRKANEVQAAIMGLRNGTLAPEDIKIDGIESEEEKKLKEIERQKRALAIKEKDEKLRLQRKQEEIDRWWSGVNIHLNKTISDANHKNGSSADEHVKLMKLADHYSSDYSRWNDWVPTDSATVEEEQRRLQEEEATRNREFEKMNPEFCGQFLDDMEKRQRAQQKKADSADACRLKGNNMYKSRSYERAAELYMEALKYTPFDVRILTNIAQVHIKLGQNEDALEFLSRTLHLDTRHVKALSRKAHVLSQMGRVAEALEFIDQACILEPANKDIAAQRLEILQIDKELREEAILRGSLPKSSQQPQVSPDEHAQLPHSPTSRLSGPTAAADEIILSVDALAVLLGPLNGASDEAACNCALDSALRCKASHAMNELVLAIGEQSLYKAYLRTSSAVHLSLLFLTQLLAAPSANGDVLTSCFDFLSCAIDGQRGSKQLLLDSKALPALKKFVTCDNPAVTPALSLLHVCCRDEVCAKLRASVLGDKVFVRALGVTVGELISSGSLSRNLSIVNGCVLLIKECAFSEHGVKVLSSGPELGTVLCSLGSVLVASLHSGTQSPGSGSLSTKDRRWTVDLLVEALLGLSQHEAVRPFLALPLPLEENKIAGTQYSSTVGALLSLAVEEEDSRSNCLAILMNGALEPSGAVRRAVAAEGGLSFLLKSLCLSDEERMSVDTSVLVRAAGLLSRVAVVEAVQCELMKVHNYRWVCRRLALHPVRPADGSQSVDSLVWEAEKWQLDERAHHVRTLASLVSPPPECRAAGHAESVVAALLSIFPRPRDDCGVFTPETVTLMPHKPESAVLLGNAARCLMSYADDQEMGGAALYLEKELLGVERLICAMATCTDLRVRKNIAILLAKGCRLPGVREKVTRLRGMEMMVELQHKF